MAVKQVSIFLENETGRLADLTQILAENGVDLNAVTIAETGEYGILRCIVQNPEEAVAALAGKGFMASITEVLTVAIENVPGAVNNVMGWGWIMHERDVSEGLRLREHAEHVRSADLQRLADGLLRARNLRICMECPADRRRMVRRLALEMRNRLA